MVEHPAAVRQVLGSTPSVPCFGDVRVSSLTFPSSQRARYQNVCDDGPNRDLNPGPPAPKAGIIPLDHLAVCPCGSRVATLNRFEQGQVSGKNSDRHVEKTLGGREGPTRPEERQGLGARIQTATRKNAVGSGGIRTHASEETGALNQRLRPLGHATFVLDVQHQSGVQNRNAASSSEKGKSLRHQVFPDGLPFKY